MEFKEIKRLMLKKLNILLECDNIHDISSGVHDILDNDPELGEFPANCVCCANFDCEKCPMTLNGSAYCLDSFHPFKEYWKNGNIDSLKELIKMVEDLEEGYFIGEEHVKIPV